MEESGVVKIKVQSGRASARENSSHMQRGNSKKLKPMNTEELDIEVSRKKSSFERYNQYTNKHAIPLVKNIQTQLDQRAFSLKAQFLPNWAIRSSIKALKYNS